MRAKSNPLVELFWKAQIRILRSCPPLCGWVAHKQRLGVQRIPRLWLKMAFRAMLQIPYAFLENIKNKATGRFVIAKTGFYLTTRCTLNCEKCGALVPYFEEQKDTDLDLLLADIEALLSAVDYIYMLGLAGGEPFMYKHLDRVIDAVTATGKVGDVTVVTNGTIIPNENVIRALKHPIVKVQISSYPAELQKNADKLQQVLKENGIACDRVGYQPWRDFGNWKKIADGKDKNRFSICVTSLTNNIFEGKYHLCCLSTMSMASGVIPNCEDDYVDLRCGDTLKIRAGLKALQKKRVISACKYCYGDTYKTPIIQPAVQAPRRGVKVLDTSMQGSRAEG